MFQEGQIGVYIHWPFCLSKCPYCDFNVYLKQTHDTQDWLNAYLTSIKTHQKLMPDAQVVSIYFGGGTPSLMKPSEVEAIINEVHKGWRVIGDVEITLEANPTSTEIDKFESFKSAGVNRLSLGVQSLRDDVLKFLGRLHNSDEVKRAIKVADQCFDRFTFDLIYALPDQSLEEWRGDLLHAIPYMKGHLSAYQLTIKGGTAFEKQEERGDFKMLSDDVTVDFYNLTNDIMAEYDMSAYEVSNYGVKGQESRHNCVYWHYQDYVGIGPGAHGRISYDDQKYASEDYKKPSEWMGAVQQNGHGSKRHEELSAEEQFTEIVMAGLRLVDGINLTSLEKQTGLNPMQYLDIECLRKLEAEGFLLFDNVTIKPTREGWLRIDSILPHILK